MSIKRKTNPKEQEKLFGEVDKLKKEGEELQQRIDKTLKQIDDYKVRKLKENKNE